MSRLRRLWGGKNVDQILDPIAEWSVAQNGARWRFIANSMRFIASRYRWRALSVWWALSFGVDSPKLQPRTAMKDLMMTTQIYDCFDGSEFWVARPRLRLPDLSLEAKLIVVDVILAVFIATCVAYA